MNAPYQAFCDPVINSDRGFHEAIEKAISLCEEKNAKYIELRSSKLLDLDWSVATDDVTFIIDLSSGSDYIFKNIKQRVRTAIRKGQKNNLYYRIGSEYLGIFFDIYSRSVRRLGTPVHSCKFFKELLQARGHFNIIVIFSENHVPISACLYAEDKETVAPLWAGGLIEYNHLSPGNVLYWALIEYGCKMEKKRFDFGRSSKNTGTYDFKKRWFSQEIQLYYYYFRKKGRIMQKKSREYEVLASLWKRMPLYITRIVGPVLRKYIP